MRPASKFDLIPSHNDFMPLCYKRLVKTPVLQQQDFRRRASCLSKTNIVTDTSSPSANSNRAARTELVGCFLTRF
jgi:hypothetical protein